MTFLERIFKDDVETVEKCRNKSDECYSDVTGKKLCIRVPKNVRKVPVQMFFKVALKVFIQSKAKRTISKNKS